jgi:hypothetical protein
MARPHRGTMILVFGILGIVLCVIFGIVAWVMGSGDLKQMQAGSMDRSGEGLTRAGMICGMVSVILNAIGLLLYIIIFVLILGAGFAASQQGTTP